MIKIHELIAASHNDALSSKLCAAVKFDLGEITKLETIAELSTNTFFEIPFGICVFHVFIPEDNSYLIFLAEDHGEDEQITFSLFKKHDGRWHQFSIWLVIDRNYENGAKSYAFSYCKQATGERLYLDGSGKLDFSLVPDSQIPAITMLAMVANAVEVFSCSNVHTIEHKPSEKLNKSRLKKKKIPFFSYHTLHINNQSEEKESKGSGTHASPRLHLRRGHIRRLSDGRRIWVTHCLVGDKSKGFAGKDYAVTHKE